MIKFENLVLASPQQIEFIIEGMRNPMNSWDKSDSYIGCCGTYCEDCLCTCKGTEHTMGIEDMLLMKKLAKAGTDHRKYLRMMPIYVRITAPLYWWKEFDTYKVGTVANSCSTMHKIHAKEFTKDDFSIEHIFKPGSRAELAFDDVLAALNVYRDYYLDTKDKNFWWQLIQLLPSSYNQTRNVMFNYEVAMNIYKSRRKHKLDEWHWFCEWLEALPYFKELVSECKED